METTSTFTPEQIMITRRPDGNYDLVALCAVPGSTDVGRVTMILEQATLNVGCDFTVRQDYMWAGGVECTVPAKATNFQASLVTRMLGGVGGQEKTFMRQEIVSAPTVDGKSDGR